MTLEQITDVVRFFVDQKMPGKQLNIEEYNTILAAVDYDLMNDVVGPVGSVEGWETEGQVKVALLPFITSSTIILTGGAGTLPTNFLHFGKCHYISGSDAIPIELVSTQESAQRRYNTITTPTTRFPIMELTGSTTFQVYPTTITPIYLSYIKKPTAASYVLVSENGVLSYDSTLSVQPEWGVFKHNDYIRHILKYLGISVNDMNIVQYTEQKQAQVN